MSIFKLTIHDRKPGSHDEAFQERNIITQLLMKVAHSIGSGSQGAIVYDGHEVGTWAFGNRSHVVREREQGDGPGTAKARQREAELP